MRDWRTHPAWGPVGVFLSVLSLFPPVSPFVRTLVIIVVLAVSAYAFFGGHSSERNPIAGKREDTQDGASPPLVQEAGNLYLADRAEEIGMLGVPLSAPVTLKVPWRNRISGFLKAVVILGLPGILLVRSDISWQHIAGIILLIIFGIAGFLALDPLRFADMLDNIAEGALVLADKSDKGAVKAGQLADKLSKRADKFSEHAHELRQKAKSNEASKDHSSTGE